jgi:type I site-specific restriction endonuclease
LLVLTPEEWVRQHVLHFLVTQGVPKGLIASEVSLKYIERTKRADVVVYGKDQKPVWIVECKAADVPLSEAVFRQIASYNHTLKVEYLMMTNGLEHIYAHINQETGKLTYLEEFPIVEY